MKPLPQALGSRSSVRVPDNLSNQKEVNNVGSKIQQLFEDFYIDSKPIFSQVKSIQMQKISKLQPKVISQQVAKRSIMTNEQIPVHAKEAEQQLDQSATINNLTYNIISQVQQSSIKTQQQNRKVEEQPQDQPQDSTDDFDKSTTLNDVTCSVINYVQKLATSVQQQRQATHQNKEEIQDDFDTPQQEVQVVDCFQKSFEHNDNLNKTIEAESDIIDSYPTVIQMQPEIIIQESVISTKPTLSHTIDAEEDIIQYNPHLNQQSSPLNDSLNLSKTFQNKTINNTLNKSPEPLEEEPIEEAYEPQEQLHEGDFIEFGTSTKLTPSTFIAHFQ